MQKRVQSVHMYLDWTHASRSVSIENPFLCKSIYDKKMEPIKAKKKRPYVKPMMKRMDFGKEGVLDGADNPCKWVPTTEKPENNKNK